MDAKEQGFHVAAFAMDGTCEGCGFWDISKFSQDLVAILSDLLRKHGEVFNSSLEDRLIPVSLQFTSANGAAIATFHVNGNLAVSSLLLSGTDSAADNSVMDMFIASARSSSASVLGRASANAFVELRHLTNRPSLAAVVWGCDAISDEDYSLVQELCLHLGAAFLLR